MNEPTEAQLAEEFSDDLARKQRQVAECDESDRPKHIGEIDRFARILKLDPENDARLERFEAERKRRDEENAVAKCVLSTRSSLGKYGNATLASYEVDRDEQQVVKSRVERMCREIQVVIDRRLNVIFWGTLGTGKDHLAACMLQAGAFAKHDCKMLAGRVFYDECSAAFSADSTQLAVYRKYTQTKVICLSDPVFEAGWSAKWGEYLNRLIRMRYDAGKATWCTVNARDEPHAREMFGFDVWDRLVENGVLLEMRWPSYRTKKSEREF